MRMLLTWFIIFAHLAGVLTAVRAIMDVRTAQGAIAWAIVVVTVPYVSVPAYWVFGRSKFHGYVLARQKEFAQTNPTARQYLGDLAARGLLANPTLGHSLAVEKLVRMHFTTGRTYS